MDPAMPLSPPWALAAGAAAVAAPQFAYARACGARCAAARPARSWGAVATFAAVNGVLETFAFRAVLDAGAAVAAAAGGTPAVAAAAGLTAFFAYCGFIHAAFWEPLVFPPHVPAPGSPDRPAMDAALALFFPMAVALACLDLRSAAALHVAADAAAAAVLRLPPPVWRGGGGGVGAGRR